MIFLLSCLAKIHRKLILPQLLTRGISTWLSNQYALHRMINSKVCNRLLSTFMNNVSIYQKPFIDSFTENSECDKPDDQVFAKDFRVTQSFTTSSDCNLLIKSPTRSEYSFNKNGSLTDGKISCKINQLKQLFSKRGTLSIITR